MKLHTIFTIALLWSLALCGQTLPLDPANGWYISDPSRTFIKLVVDQEGIYHVSQSDLTNAGFSLSGVNPDNLHLYRRGLEQAIYVKSNAGNLDFLEFYGNKNDGVDDTLMYRNPTANMPDGSISPDIRKSLFTDEAAYFLTWDNSPGLRLNNFFNGNYGSFPALPNFRYETYFDYPAIPANYELGGGAQFDFFRRLSASYVTGEGYSGSSFQFGIPVTEVLSTPGVDNSSANPKEIMLRAFAISSWEHIWKFSLNGNVVVNDTLIGVDIRSWSAPYSGTFSASTSVTFEAFGTQNNNTDNNRVTSLGLRYDRLPDLGGGNSVKMVEWMQNSASYLALSNVNGQDSGWAYDLATNTRISGVMNAGKLDLIIPGSTLQRDIFVVSDSGLLSPLKIEASTLSNLSAASNSAEYVIITSPALINSAQAYASYRDTAKGGISVKIVQTDEIYDEFGFGEPTSLAIKRFCMTALDHWTVKPRYIVIWGKGAYQTRSDPAYYVPSWGYPAGDIEYVSNHKLWPLDYLPRAAIGRIPIKSDVEGMTYLQKVDEYEHTKWDPWMLNGLFMTGGTDTLEQKPLIAYSNKARSDFEGNNYGGTGYYYQMWNGGLDSNSSFVSDSVMANGASWIHLFGHSDANTWDLNFKEPDQYNNWGKYPVIFGLGNATADFTEPGGSLAERYLLEPGRGAIAYYGFSTYSFLSPIGDYSNRFSSFAFDQQIGSTLGKLWLSSLNDFLGFWSDPLHRSQVAQHNLLGDPAITPYNPVNTTLIPPEEDFPVVIYPNPTSSQIWVQFGLQQAGQAHLCMHDVLGREVKVESLGFVNQGMQNVQFNTIGLAKGAYFLNLFINGQNKHLGKVIIQ